MFEENLNTDQADHLDHGGELEQIALLWIDEPPFIPLCMGDMGKESHSNAERNSMCGASSKVRVSQW